MKPTPQECDNALAALLSSTKRRSRPLDLVETAKELRTAIDCFGTVETVADRIGLSTSMLRRFQYVERLSGALQTLVKARKIDSIDAVAELSSLTQADQTRLAKVLANEAFATEDIRGFGPFFNKHPEMPFDEVVSRVRASKTRRLYIFEFVAREQMRDPETVASKVLRILSPEDFHSVDVSNVVGRLKVSKSGKQRITLEAKKRKLSVTNFVQQLCEGLQT